MTINNQNLSHKVALVTGSGGGIGLAIAQAYLKNGAKVMLTDYAKEAPNTLHAVLEEFPESALYIGADICNKQEVEHVINLTIERFPDPQIEIVKTQEALVL